MKFSFNDRLVNAPILKGFRYVDQDNYYIVNLNELDEVNPVSYLHSDSATSCIIVIVEGKDKNSNPIVALSHLSRTERFETFFDIVANNFVGPINVFAQGANPSNAEASKTNSETLLAWIAKNRNSNETGWIAEVTLSLGLGNPQEENRGTYGIDLTTMTVSNNSFELTLEDRDPTGGLQILYCVFGLKVSSVIPLHHTGSSFTSEQINSLVEYAYAKDWTKILSMTQGETLAKYSSTPDCEVPWFYAELRQSALYVKEHF